MDTPINTSDAQVNSSEEVSKSKLEKISFIVLLITIIFVPLAFIPTAYAPIDMTKTLVVTAGILVSSILYFLSIFKSRKISIPKHPLVTVGAALVVSILVSAVLSANFEKAFFGQVFELGTASFILVLFLGGLLTAIFAEKDKDRIVYVYGALILSFAVLILFHLVRIFAGVDFMDFGIFQALTSTMIGKWNDLAIFAAIIGIIAYTSIQFLVLSRASIVLIVIVQQS